MILLKKYSPIILILICACFTQFIAMSHVPGPHFDEAWQGLFINRILNEPGFFPTQAMNSYTTPVLHYMIAGFFKIFSIGPSLFSIRCILSLMNIITVLLLFRWVQNLTKSKSIAITFCLFWCVLPLSIHTRRFYIEITTLHPFLLSIFLNAFQSFHNHTKAKATIIALTFILGTLSHIVYMAHFLVFIYWVHSQPVDAKHTRALKYSILSCIFIFFPILFRIQNQTYKFSILLVIILFLFLTIFYLFKEIKEWVFLKYFDPLFSILFYISFIFFGLFHFSGIWSLKQITFDMHWFWLIPNLLFLVYILLKLKGTNFISKIFTIELLITLLFVLKPSPRFMLVPLLFFILLIFQNINWNTNFQRVALLFLISWNILIFDKVYLEKFISHGSVDSEFKIGFYKDSSRDFRPFQKIQNWLKENNCEERMEWIEDDRFILPIEYLRLGSPTKSSTTVCPFKKNTIFISHIPEYQKMIHTSIPTQNWPVPTPEVELFKHEQSWGDLAIFIRKMDYK